MSKNSAKKKSILFDSFRITKTENGILITDERETFGAKSIGNSIEIIREKKANKIFAMSAAPDEEYDTNE